MARIFAGELSMIDQEVFDTLKQLPDTFWVFAEINIGRNIDWFIIRPDNPSTLILTELKRINKPLRGAVNGLWEKQSSTGDWEEVPANGTDTNPYWQAVNSANALADWLWNNQQLYRETAEIRPSADFRVWPDLLLLSPPGTQHRLPLAPPSRYGRWWFNVDEWMRHVRGWTPRTGVNLSHQEVRNLIDALRLTEVWAGNGEEPVEVSVPVLSLAPPPAETATSSEPMSFASYIQNLEQRIARLEQESAYLRTRDREREQEMARLRDAAVLDHESAIPHGAHDADGSDGADGAGASGDVDSLDNLDAMEMSCATEMNEVSTSVGVNEIP